VKPRYLIDSVILIDHLNGEGRATDWLAGLGEDEAVLSPVTRAEVLAGVTEKELPDVLGLLDEFPCLPISAGTADAAAALRRSRRWKLPDAFQAALAQEHGLQLATRNTKDFSETKHPFVKVPYHI
jgi:predicted nucleic acid-binding protein